MSVCELNPLATHSAGQTYFTLKCHFLSTSRTKWKQISSIVVSQFFYLDISLFDSFLGTNTDIADDGEKSGAAAKSSSSD